MSSILKTHMSFQLSWVGRGYTPHYCEVEPLISPQGFEALKDHFRDSWTEPHIHWSRVVYLAFILGTALSRNLGMQIPFRFLAGLGASIILTIHGASIADMFDAEGRSIAWHSAVIFFMILFLPETFAPILLKWKASQMRKRTGHDKYMLEIEIQHSFRARITSNLRRGWILATREYIVIFLGTWIVVLCFVVFGLLHGFEYIFGETYGFSDGLVGTSFAALAVGVVLNTALSPFPPGTTRQER